MEIDGIPYLVKTTGRPNLVLNEVVLDHINVKRYVKGKQNEQLTVTLYDPIVPSGGSQLWSG